jgi:hypothetical protein
LSAQQPSPDEFPQWEDEIEPLCSVWIFDPRTSGPDIFRLPLTEVQSLVHRLRRAAYEHGLPEIWLLDGDEEISADECSAE